MGPKDFAGMMKIRERMNLFAQEHPKFGAFLNAVQADAQREGTVLELKVTNPEGKTYITNIRLTADDVQTIEMLQQLRR